MVAKTEEKVNPVDEVPGAEQVKGEQIETKLAEDAAAESLKSLKTEAVRNAVIGSVGGKKEEGEKDNGSSGRWTNAEDESLRLAVQEIGPRNWKRVASEYLADTRTDVQCLHRWQKVLRPGLVKGPWKPEEDEMIRNCIAQGITKWSEISKMVAGRIGKQCRERWFNHLDPSIKKEKWSTEEDELLIQGQKKYGNKWSKIAKEFLPGRPENAVKNRWNAAARRKKADGENKLDIATSGSSAKNSELSTRKKKSKISTVNSKKSEKSKTKKTKKTKTKKQLQITVESSTNHQPLDALIAVALDSSKKVAQKEEKRERKRKRKEKKKRQQKEAIALAAESAKAALDGPEGKKQKRGSSFSASRPNLSNPIISTIVAKEQEKIAADKDSTDKTDNNKEAIDESVTPIWNSPSAKGKNLTEAEKNLETAALNILAVAQKAV